MTPYQRIRDALAAVALAFIAYGLVDLNDRPHDMPRTEYVQWVNDACFPRRENERAVAVLDEGKLRCTIYGNTGHGRAPRIISAAVMERP